MCSQFGESDLGLSQHVENKAENYNRKLNPAVPKANLILYPGVR